MGHEINRNILATDAADPLLPAMFARYQDMVGQALCQAVPDPSDTELSTLLHYHLGGVDRYGVPIEVPTSQGKALRPTLCMFACEALNGDPLRALPAASALELIHNFSLIHDDIQDQDLERRHQPTVWSLWGAAKALVAGDAMQSLGDLAVMGSAQRGVPLATTLRISQLLTESYLEMIEGQCQDLGFESSTSITTQDYLQMIACKTGALIRSSLEIGAVLATDDPDTTVAFARFGSCLGRAFQIRDDFLGIWGDEATTGKSTESDIRRRKKSFPVVFAFERAEGAAREDLSRIYSQEALEESDINRVLEVLDEVGASESSQRLTRESAAQALEALQGVSLPSWAKTEVGELVEFLARRQF